jgi:tetratricopeptide (TPR) repeat protein
MSVAALALCVLLWLPTQGPYERAVRAFQQGHFEEVLSLLDSLPEQEAHRPAASNLRAVALMKLRRFDEALAAGQEATRLDPGNPNYIYNVGLIYLAKNDFQGAQDVFRLAIQRFPQSSRLYEGWGETLFSMNRFKEAEAKLRKAVELDPASADAEVGLAKLFYALGEHQQFGAAASKAIQLNPQNPRACYYYGKHLIEDQRQFAEGAEYIRKSVTLSPDFVQGLIEWGEILSRAKRWDEAADTYERALGIEPTNIQICYLLYTACRNSGRVEKAEWALKKYQTLAKEQAPRSSGDRQLR